MVAEPMDPREPSAQAPAARSRRHRILGLVAYWLTVLVISVGIAVAVISYLIARDEASLEPTATGPVSTAAP